MTPDDRPSAPALDFEALFNRSPNPYMVLTPDFRLVAANDAYLRETASTREAILGRSLFEAFPGDPNDPTPTHQLRASLERVVARRAPDTLALIRYAIARPTPNGVMVEERFWSATHTPLFDERGEVAYILQHTVDVTELQLLKQSLRAAEQALEDGVPQAQVEEGVFRRAQVLQEANTTLDLERRQLRRLFDQAPGFIAILRGPAHVFELANRAYLQLVRHRDILGKAVAEALPEVVEQGFVTLLDRVYSSGEPFVGRGMAIHLQRTPDAPLEEVFVDFVYQPIVESDGSISGIFVEGHEVTQQIRAQAELQELNDTLEQRVAERTAELEARNRELQEFAYVASHDLQEPLRKVYAFADLLVEEYGPQLPEEGLHYLERMQAASRRMSVLIRDLLAYSRVSTQGQQFRSVDLNRIVQEAAGDLQPGFDEAGGRVEAGPLPQIEADPLQMRQLFQHLFGNALKFRKPGIAPLIQVSAALEQAADGRSQCRLEIRDNGIGFGQQYADRVFVPFQRLHTRQQYEGTGIGLAICRRIAERHGGTITATSTPDEGATFILRLPLRHDEAAGEANPGG